MKNEETLIKSDPDPGPDDLSFQYAVRLSSAGRDIVQVNNVITLPTAFHLDCLADAPRRITDLFQLLVAQPLMAAVERHVGQRVSGEWNKAEEAANQPVAALEFHAAQPTEEIDFMI